MIYKPKGRRKYKVKFRFRGKLIHQSTTATTAKTAKSIEGQIRAELEKGNWGILEKKPAQPLAEFLNKDFEPFIETKFKAKRKTLDYYKYGIKGLLDSPLAKLRLDKITDQHAGQYAAKRSCLTASTVNCGLRTLRRALKLAVEWCKMDRMPKLSPAKGERQRERVLTDEEVPRYLEGCPQPWHDAVAPHLTAPARFTANIYVRPGEKGAGWALAKTASDVLAAAGVRTIVGMVGATNTPSILLTRMLGGRIVARLRMRHRWGQRTISVEPMAAAAAAGAP